MLHINMLIRSSRIENAFVSEQYYFVAILGLSDRISVKRRGVHNIFYLI